MAQKLMLDYTGLKRMKRGRHFWGRFHSFIDWYGNLTNPKPGKRITKRVRRAALEKLHGAV